MAKNVIRTSDADAAGDLASLLARVRAGRVEHPPSTEMNLGAGRDTLCESGLPSRILSRGAYLHDVPGLDRFQRVQAGRKERTEMAEPIRGSPQDYDGHGASCQGLLVTEVCIERDQDVKFSFSQRK